MTVAATPGILDMHTKGGNAQLAKQAKRHLHRGLWGALLVMQASIRTHPVPLYAPTASKASILQREVRHQNRHVSHAKMDKARMLGLMSNQTVTTVQQDRIRIVDLHRL